MLPDIQSVGGISKAIWCIHFCAMWDDWGLCQRENMRHGASEPTDSVQRQSFRWTLESGTTWPNCCVLLSCLSLRHFLTNLYWAHKKVSYFGKQALTSSVSDLWDASSVPPSSGLPCPAVLEPDIWVTFWITEEVVTMDSGRVQRRILVSEASCVRLFLRAGGAISVWFCLVLFCFVIREALWSHQLYRRLSLALSSTSRAKIWAYQPSL